MIPEEAWIMGESTTVYEKVAFLHWQTKAAFARGSMSDLDPEQALRVVFPLLGPDEQQAIVALTQRVPGFVQYKSLNLTPGAHTGKD